MKTSDIWHVTGKGFKKDGDFKIDVHVHGLANLPPIQAEMRAKGQVIAEIWKEHPEARFEELKARPL